MKAYRYSWPKQDGTLGSKQTSSAEAMLRFISDGEGDRTIFAETHGLFSVMDLNSGTYETMTFAALIRGFLKEVEMERQQRSPVTVSAQESA